MIDVFFTGCCNSNELKDMTRVKCVQGTVAKHGQSGADISGHTIKPSTCVD